MNLNLSKDQEEIVLNILSAVLPEEIRKTQENIEKLKALPGDKNVEFKGTPEEEKEAFKKILTIFVSYLENCNFLLKTVTKIKP